jgi:hypothetical protein
MHWGWTAGYRFISLNGVAARVNGSFLDAIGIEGLGDVNYKINSYNVNAKLENNKMYIDFIAEYNGLLDGIKIAGGVNNHGETGSAADLVKNATLKVFTPASPTSTTQTASEIRHEVIYFGTDVSVRYNLSSFTGVQFHLLDMNGHEMMNVKLKSDKGELLLNKIQSAGNYIYSFSRNNNIISTGKLIKF